MPDTPETSPPMTARRRWVFRLICAAVSLLVFVLFGEMVVRIVDPQDLSGRWRVQNKRGLTLNKDSGTARHESVGHLVKYHFFEHHLRGVPKKDAQHHVLVVGDSFTFGWLLPWEDTAVFKLQQKIDAVYGVGTVQLLNASTGGWGTSDYLAYLEEYLAAVNPDAVLVVMNVSDLERSYMHKLYSFKNESTGILQSHDIPQRKLRRVANAVPGYSWMVEHSHLLTFVRAQVAQLEDNRHREVLEDFGYPDDDGDAEFVPRELNREAQLFGQALFRRMKSVCTDHGVQLWVTTTGTVKPVELFDPGLPTAAFLSSAESFFREEEVPYYDPSPLVRYGYPGLDRSMAIQGDGHPSSKCTTIIADAIWGNFLQAQVQDLVKIP